MAMCDTFFWLLAVVTWLWAKIYYNLSILTRAPETLDNKPKSISDPFTQRLGNFSSIQHSFAKNVCGTERFLWSYLTVTCVFPMMLGKVYVHLYFVGFFCFKKPFFVFILVFNSFVKRSIDINNTAVTRQNKRQHFSLSLWSS